MLRLEITNEELAYKTAFRNKVVKLKDIVWVDFEHTDFRLTREKTEEILFKCDNDVDKIKTGDLYLGYFDFPRN